MVVFIYAIVVLISTIVVLPPPIYTVPLVVNPISVYSLIKSWQMVILRFTLNFDDKIFLKENQKLVYDQGRCPYLSAY